MPDQNAIMASIVTSLINMLKNAIFVLFHSIFVSLIFFNTMVQCSVNSLAPGRRGSNLKSIIFKLVIQNSSLGTRWEIVPW